VSAGIYLWFKVPSLVVCLGLLMVYETLTGILFGGETLYVRGNITLFGQAPASLILFVIVVIAFHILFNHTLLGYNIRSIGHGQLVARNIGVNVNKTTFWSFVISGLFIGLSGALSLSLGGAVEPKMNMDSFDLMFTSMMCVIVAQYLSKYCNITIAIFIACLTWKLLGMGLLCMGISSTMQQVGQGLFLVIFIGLSSNQNKRDETRRLHVLRQQILSRMN
jgi:ribose transport system permease protein